MLVNSKNKGPLSDWDTLPFQIDESTREIMDIGEIKAILKEYPVTKIGPTRQIDPDTGTWLLPERSLGWHQAKWAEKWISGLGRDSWAFSAEQLRWQLWWKAVDEDGKFLFQRGVLQRSKGWGKDPMVAADAIIEWIGPSEFYGFDRATGMPIGRQRAESKINVLAVTVEQTRNTSDMFTLLLPAETMKHFNLKKLVTRLQQRNSAREIIMLPMNPAALQGKRSSVAYLGETQHWYHSNSGVQQYETVEQNASKVGGRLMSFTNGFLPGEESVAEMQRREWEKVVETGENPSKMLYDSVEAHPKTPLDEKHARAVYSEIRGDSVWQSIDDVLPSILSESTSLAKRRRMWFNQIVSADDALFPPAVVDELMDEDYRLYSGDEIVLGFDGGKTDDSTALVAMKPDGYVGFLLGLWERPSNVAKGRWRVPEKDIDAFVRDVFEKYTVVGFYSDLHPWESWIHQWEVSFGESLEVKATERQAIGWDMRGRHKMSTEAHEFLLSAIQRKHIVLQSDLRLRSHMLNARRKETTWGLSFQKESAESPKKIDAYTALMLAYRAAVDVNLKRGGQDQAQLYLNRI